jgi:hypothetical protein
MQGTGNFAAGNDFRSQVEIGLIYHPDTSPTAPFGAVFTVYKAWPTSLAFSDLDAGANQLFISQMTLAHEGFDVSVATSVTSDASAASLFNS